jgi:hypothetical protein
MIHKRECVSTLRIEPEGSSDWIIEYESYCARLARLRLGHAVGQGEMSPSPVTTMSAFPRFIPSSDSLSAVMNSAISQIAYSTQLVRRGKPCMDS